MKTVGKTMGKAVVFCLVMMRALFICLSAGTDRCQSADNEEQRQMEVKSTNMENLTTDTKEAVGSALIGQDFTEDCYFQGRVSSVNYNTYTEEQKENGEYAGVCIRFL